MMQVNLYEIQFQMAEKHRQAANRRLAHDVLAARERINLYHPVWNMIGQKLVTFGGHLLQSTQKTIPSAPCTEIIRRPNREGVLVVTQCS